MSGDYHGYRAGTQAWELKDLQDASGVSWPLLPPDDGLSDLGDETHRLKNGYFGGQLFGDSSAVDNPATEPPYAFDPAAPGTGIHGTPTRIAFDFDGYGTNANLDYDPVTGWSLLDLRGVLLARRGLGLRVFGSPPSDGDFDTAFNGLMVLGSDGTIWVRAGGVWKSVVTA